MVYVPPVTQCLAQQIQAWGYYGNYGLAGVAQNGMATYGAVQNGSREAVGEVRYVVGWAADQMARMKWSVLVDGESEWELEMPDGSSISSVVREGNHTHADASEDLLKTIGWTNNIVRLVSTNLYVAGELFYVLLDNQWHVVSVIHPNLKQIFERAKYVVRGLWPSPVDPTQPDAPLFGVLSILQDMDWLSRLSRSQSANRVGMRGILGSADGLNFAGGGDFWTEWDNSIRKKMSDPTDVGPVHLRGAKELVEPQASGRGMGGLSWIVPDFPYDARIEGRMEALIHRLSYGLPIPPEILLGLQAQSRATAFQVEENSYRAHIEPPAQIVAQVATDVLNTLFDGVEIEVVPDPSLLLAKRHTTEDVKDAHDRFAVSDAYLRQVLGIPEHARPSPEEKAARIAATQATAPAESSPTTETPKERADRHDKEDPSNPSGHDLISPEWRVRIEAAIHEARRRLGAKVRTHKSLRDSLQRELANSEVPAFLGIEVMESAGIDVASVVSESLSHITPATRGGDNLVDALTEHILETLDETEIIFPDDTKIAKLLQDLAK